MSSFPTVKAKDFIKVIEIIGSKTWLFKEKSFWERGINPRYQNYFCTGLILLSPY